MTQLNTQNLGSKTNMLISLPGIAKSSIAKYFFTLLIPAYNRYEASKGLASAKILMKEFCYDLT